ncbi:uncharacterized protein [Nerophis lumbriciformis]|uniref:uncharacterized protein n=1 Tax=Nerophis lumbriciformis TaxID=546530 RepID=UPI003BA850BA
MLEELVKERLMAAADDILALFARTIASYEDQLSRSREEKKEEVSRSSREEKKKKERHGLEELCRTGLVLDNEDGRPQRGSSTLEQHEPQPPHMKEEEEWSTQEEAYAPEWSVVCVKDEESSQLHGSEETRGAEPPGADMLWSHPPEDQHTQGEGAEVEGDVQKGCGRKRVTCSVCAQSFSKKNSLTQHMRSHTGEKPFSCSVCHERFARKPYLVTHMRTHTGEKPFSCPVCGRRFSQQGAIIFHMRTHTGEKPFSCLVCGERFARKSNMASHRRTHSGEKLFSCSLCGQHFSHQSHVAKHLEKHH